MAWNQWSHKYNARLCVAVPKEKKYYDQKHYQHIDKMIEELRAGFGVFASNRYLSRFQWKIHNPEFYPKLRVKIEIVNPIIRISPLDENGNCIATMYKNM